MGARSVLDVAMKRKDPVTLLTAEKSIVESEFLKSRLKLGTLSTVQFIILFFRLLFKNAKLKIHKN